MTTLPTFAECAAVPAEKRTALERFIHAWTPDDVGYEYPGFDWRDQLTAVIDAERKERDALASELRLAKSAAEYNGEMLDKVRKEHDALAAENERLRKDAERWRYLSSQMCYEVRPHVEQIAGVNGPRYRRFYHDSTYTTATSIQEAIDAALKETTT